METTTMKRGEWMPWQGAETWQLPHGASPMMAGICCRLRGRSTSGFFLLSLFFFFASLGIGGEHPAQPSAELLVKKNEIETVEDFEVELRIMVPAGSLVRLPETLPWEAPFELASFESSREEKEGGIQVVASYHLWCRRAGSFKVGPVKVAVTLPDGKEVLVEAAAVEIQVASFLATLQSSPGELRPLKGFLPPPPEQAGSARLYWGVLGALLFASFLWWWFRLRNSRGFGGGAFPPHEIALRRLKALEQRELDSARSVEAFYVDLSGALRHYLEERYRMPVMEQTTQEIKRHFEPNLFGVNWTFRLYQLLERMDLVKFAKFRISGSAAFEDLQVARALVVEVVERDQRLLEEERRRAALAKKGDPTSRKEAER